jgi:hypothetical protein
MIQKAVELGVNWSPVVYFRQMVKQGFEKSFWSLFRCFGLRMD